MIGKDSRYSDAQSLDDDEGLLNGFTGIRARAIGPATGVIEHVVAGSDRFDMLALRYYNDTRKWWRILDANPNVLYADDLFQEENRGATILIPQATEPRPGL